MRVDVSMLALVAPVAVLLAALLTRDATRYSAHLGALQRARDAQIVQLDEFGETLIDTLVSVRSYIFATESDVRTRVAIHPGEVPGYFALVESSYRKLQRCRYLSEVLPWSEVKAAFRSADAVMHETLSPAIDGRDAWDDATEMQPTPMTTAVDAVAARRRELQATYPTRVPRVVLRRNDRAAEL